MSRVFAYARVSTREQNTENQLREIRAAGFDIEDRRTIVESVSGSVPTNQRKGFSKLMDRMEMGDILVVTKLDRLGRNAMDVRSTVEALATTGVRVHCLALGGVDLTSAAGRMTMQVLNAVAEFERDLLIERTNAGIERAKSEGKHMGRPALLSETQRTHVIQRIEQGESISAVARDYRTTRQTIMRVQKAAIQ